MKKGHQRGSGGGHTSFPNTPKLKELIKQAHALGSPKVNGDAQQMGLSQLEEWKNRASQELQRLVETDGIRPLNELADYLLEELRREPM